MPRSISDLVRTFEDRFRVGKAGGGAKSFELFNGFLGRLLWTPTANRDITIPDAAGTIVLQNGGRIDGLAPAITNGQAATFEQLSNPTAQYEGATSILVLPNNTTALSQVGTSLSTVGTVATPAQVATNHLTQTRRFTLASGAIAGNLVHWRHPSLVLWRGNAVRRGGFRVAIRFGNEVSVAGQRYFWGIQDSGAAPTNVDPLTAISPGRIGLAINETSTTWRLINNITGTAPTILDLGANFPVNNTDMYELVSACLPNAAGIDYVVTNLATGISLSGTLTTNIPNNTTFLLPYMWGSNNATAAAITAATAMIRATSPF
jgi:hypothetical protein